MKTLDRIILLLLGGFTIGALLSLSTKYPLKVDTIDQYKHLCVTPTTLTHVWVGLDGDIYKIKCSDGKVIQIPQLP
jgi:hypothetical protein